MINANEARAIGTNYEAEKEAEMRSKIEAFLDGEVTDRIKAVAKTKHSTNVSIPTSFDAKYFEKRLVENGFNFVHLTPTFYTITW